MVEREAHESARQFESRFEGRESKETRENEMTPEAMKAAAKERAEFLMEAVKQSSSQMKNIATHVAQVKQAIKQIRAMLQIQDNDDHGTASAQDEARVQALRQKVATYQNELIHMRGDLINYQIEDLQNAGFTGSMDDLEREATARVDQLLRMSMPNGQ